MALREVLKASTSETHQKGLTIAMQETTAAASALLSLPEAVSSDIPTPTTKEDDGSMKID